MPPPDPTLDTSWLQPQTQILGPLWAQQFRHGTGHRQSHRTRSVNVVSAAGTTSYPPPFTGSTTS